MTLKHYEWTEWVDIAATPHGVSTSRDGKPSFYGEPIAEAVERARGAGFWEAIPEAEQYAARINTEIITERLQTTFSTSYAVAGAEVDMGRYLSGEPECMIESLPIQLAKRGRAVRIVIPGCYAGATEIQSVRNRGAAILALCQVLARAQHPLEVWVGFANHGSSGARHAFMVRVQRANEPLDEGRVLYALAHETSNRRLCFSVKEQQDERVRRDFGIPKTRAGGTYGQSPRHCLASDLPDEEANTIIVEDFDRQPDWDIESAVAWINKTLSDLFER